jgi:putative ABC transport system substrate-binding protein
MRKLGVLSGSAENDPNNRTWFSAFDGELQSIGWKEHQNILIERRYAPGDIALMRTYAKELVALRPDLIFVTTTPSAVALLQESRTIPILFANISDPVGSGLVSSLAHPGGNATGVTNFEFTMGGKWLQLIKNVAPGVTRTAVIFNPETAPYWPGYVHPAEAAAGPIGIKLVATPVRDRSEVESALLAQAREPGGSIIVLPDSFTISHREWFISPSARHLLPAVYPYRTFALDGGLIVYGPDIADLYRRSAHYVDRILRGEKPAELPVEQPNKFELIINLKTAKAFGLTIPEILLATANELID